MTWAVFCDFDGTVAAEDSTDLLLERHAALEWREIEAQWARGEIGSAECMRRQVELVRATRADLDRVADDLTPAGGFPEFVDYCEQRAIPVCVVSDGLDQVIHRFLRRHGLQRLPVLANRLRQLSQNRYTLDSPYRAAGCNAGTCKCRILDAGGSRPRLFIGDGRSDFCAAENAADFVIAKDSLLRHCNGRSIPHVAFQGFAHASSVLHRLIQATPARVPLRVSPLVHEPALS